MQAVREKITNKLSDVSEIAAGIYRGVRRQDGKDFAAYVFDLNSRLPRTVGHLSSYLDDVLGQSYFSETAAADLRWNNYLYFVVNDDEARTPGFNAIKKALEADRSYARKYVILKDDLEQVLDELDAVAVVNEEVQTTDVLQVWSEKLSPNGLDDVLDENRAVSDIVREVSTGSARNTVRTRRASGIQESNQLVSSRLESVNLGKFRPYPKQGEVTKLGKANLIFGPNGAGKTSFMEGLEFLYCGANRRSSASAIASVTGRLQSGEVVTTSQAQLLSDFKTRQRMWYGSDDLSRNNNLPNQFSRFNFLNTDAAAELSLIKGDSKPGQKNNSETLADLLSGHEATEVWKRIQSLQKAIAGEERDRRSDRDKAKIEKEANAEILRRLESSPGEAAASFSIFVKNLEGIAWYEIPKEAQMLAGGLADRLAELASYLTVVRQMGWLGNDIHEKLIGEMMADFAMVMPALKEEISQIQMSEIAAKSLAHKHRTATARKEALSKIQPDAVEDLVKLTKSLQEAKDELSLNAKTFTAVFVDVPPEGWKNRYGQQSVNDAYRQCLALEAKINEELSNKKKGYADLTSMQTKLQNAITQVHDWARAVVEHRHSDESCPVCNTEFAPGELLRRMSEHVSIPTELASTDLKHEIDRLTRESLDIISVRKWLSSLFKFAETVPGGTSLVVLEAQSQAVSAYVRSYDLFALTKQNQTRLNEYALAGLTLQEVEKLFLPLDGVQLNDSSFLDIEAAKRSVDTYLQELKNRKSETENKLSLHNAEVIRLLAILSLNEQPSHSVAVEMVETRYEQLKRAAAMCNELRFHLALDSTTSLTGLCGLIEASVLSAKNVISLMEQEAKADTEKNAISKKMAHLDSRIKECDESIRRLENAAAALKDIADNHSLDSATEAVVEAAHTVADSIFNRIHTPAEYRVNATPDIPLTRRDSGAAVQLNEVSTGQRAAYALSMFLAMNAQVKDGPKVMLLDDPISHVDDLNALSFLDYLRNVVLKSDRQLFFATADEKIAGLFAHKFSFLGDDFQIIELSRG
ncbi:hypothetical protein ACN9MY_01810 [Pseudoduganella sp. R-31]|uniref:hypothetical protein n=1 Tax=Pseudoduganella sp. R-31 TaxID=3404060 RepID=UPI003CF3D5FC